MEEKIKKYFRERYNRGKGDWVENHDLARDLIEILKEKENKVENKILRFK